MGLPRPDARDEGDLSRDARDGSAGKGLQEQALEAFQRAVALDPVDPTIWENYGNALNRAQHVNPASLCFVIARAYQKLPFLAECRSVPRDGWNALTEQFNAHLRSRPKLDEARDPIHCFWSNLR